MSLKDKKFIHKNYNAKSSYRNKEEKIIDDKKINLFYFVGHTFY